MIAAALAAGTVCLAIVAREAIRPASSFAAARIFVAGAWACCWIAYGVNLTGFPVPSATTWWLLAAGCGGALVMVPGSRVERASDPAAFGTRSRVVAGGLALLALFVIAWDIAYLASRVHDYGWSIGLKTHRIDRMTSTGGFALPGIEVMRAMACAAGALAFARWCVTRRLADAAVAVLGLVAAILATGRWEVVNYLVWLFIAARLVAPSPRGLRAFAGQMAFCVVMGVFFVAHGQLFGKNEHAAAMANLPEQARMKAAGKVVRTEVAPAAMPKPAAATAPVVAPAPTPTTTATPTAVPTPPPVPLAPAPPPAPIAVNPCPRWAAAAQASNQSFRTLPPAAIALLLYAAGPFAALDRVLCEGPAEVRQVIFYWPKKILRTLNLRQPETLLAVDPFVDVGIPFNNYSVIFPFVNELGLWIGPIAWLLLAGALRWASGRVARSQHPALIVAAAAPISMAIRTPWANTYFDGTLAAWILVALISWWASHQDARTGTTSR